MSYIAIKANNISKQYRIGGNPGGYKTLRESLMGLFKSLLKKHTDAQSNILWALKDVSFEVEQGEVIGIIGRNGAGKSTLLKILTRITKPTTGLVKLRGRVGSLLEVGTGFHPELTGRDNIYLNGAILGMRRFEIDRKFDQIVEFSEISRFLDTPVKFYSSGMYMRLAFAVAAHLEPEILLVDEVLAVGDAAFQKKCLGKMGEVAKEGRTVLFVSHNLAAVQQICERGILIHEGRILYQDKIDKVVREYLGGTATSKSEVEISSKDHVTGINGIQVRRVKLVNTLTDSFSTPWMQPIHLLIEIDVIKPVRNINFGIGITAIDGVPVFTIHSMDENEETVSLLQPGSYEIEVQMDNPLRIGLYNLILGAHEAVAKTSIFYIPNAVRLEITPPITQEDKYIEHNTGIVNSSGRWKISNYSKVILDSRL